MVRDTPIARILRVVRVLIIRLRIQVGFPLQLQKKQCSSYQGQQGDPGQYVRGNYKTRFWGGQNLTAVEGNASVYSLYILRSI